jgi:hypothetical protein
VALAYGVYIMFEARPVYTAFVKDRFEVVPADQLDAVDLAEGPAEYRMLSFTGPRMVGVRFPDQSNAEEWNKLVFSGVAGKDIQNFPKYYPYADAKAMCSGSRAARRAAQGPSERSHRARRGDRRDWQRTHSPTSRSWAARPQ